ncbi:MAG: SpoVA/SpoVAEb family sporulation membrane protein [Anaerovoracaceae bacterium]
MEYKRYAKQFEDRPAVLRNCIKAFVAGGLVCLLGCFFQSWFLGFGMEKEVAGTWSTVSLIVIAQILTGLGWYDSLGKTWGAGVIVPITGFANAVVAPAIEYKAEGPVLGVGAKIFSLSGPVILSGVALSWIVGVVYWILDVL